MFCSNCGKELTGKFCSECGAPANASVQNVATQPSPNSVNINGQIIDMQQIKSRYGTNKVAAIKYLHNTTGISLHEAKDQIDKAFKG